MYSMGGYYRLASVVANQWGARLLPSPPPAYVAGTAMRPSPPLPPDCPACFRSTIHGLVFDGRAALLEQLRPGDELMLLPGAPVEETPGVWVHLQNGDLLGRLPPEIEYWLARWLLAGGRARATALKVRGQDEPSWRRVLLEITCLA